MITTEIISTERFMESTVIQFKLYINGICTTHTEPGDGGVVVDRVYRIQIQDDMDIDAELSAYISRISNV